MKDKDKKSKLDKMNNSKKYATLIKLQSINSSLNHVDTDSFIFTTFIKSYLIDSSPIFVDKEYELNFIKEIYKFKVIEAKTDDDTEISTEFNVNINSKIEINKEKIIDNSDINEILRVVNEKFPNNCKIYKKKNFVNGDNMIDKFSNLKITDSIKDESDEIAKFIYLSLKIENTDISKNKYNSSKFLYKGLVLSGEHGNGKTYYLEKAINKLIEDKKIDYLCVFSVDNTDIDKFKTFCNFSKMIKNSFLLITNQITHKLVYNNSEESGIINEENKFAIEIIKEMDMNNSIVVIETTHSIEDFYKELRLPGRFDYHININLPDYLKRSYIINDYLDYLSHDLSENDIIKFIDKTQGFTPADIMSVLK